MVKGILKRYSRPGIARSESTNAAHQDDSPKPKRVSFDGPEPVRVFQADEWDRTPAEVTLKLTYKDVVELRELNVSLGGSGSLVMERTPSRRPTPRTAVPRRSPPLKESLKTNTANFSSDDSFIDMPASRPSSPVLIRSGQAFSPSYQYHAFSSHSLSPLLEDASFAVSPPSTMEHRGRSYGVSSLQSSISPPGLPIRTPLLKGLPSPTLPPPSPLLLSPPLPSRSPSPKLSPPVASSIPLYRHPRARTQPTPSLLKTQGPTEKHALPVVFPTLSRCESVPEKLVFDKSTTDTEGIMGRDSPSPTWKSLDLLDTETNLSAVSVTLNRDTDSSPSSAITPVVTRKNGRSLMGWELKRGTSAQGKLTFGLVRKQGV